MSNGLDFERQVHALLKNMGFEAEITKASGDGGIDIIAHSKEHITGGKYIIQCKDWSKPVGEPPVRDLFGVVTAESANKGILITTSTFTSPAINFAAGKPLELIDGAKFNQLLSKYSVAGSQGGALPTADDERIKALTEQLNKNPKNILIMKELADLYLLQANYNRAAELYETIIPLKPTVETERLTNAYTGGLNNYGVALAKLKRYDEAIKMFQQAFYKGCLQEASLTHYLGLYDIATELYQKVKSIANRPEIFDEFIERAYLQMPPVYPHLSPVLSQDETNDAILIPLETVQQKAEQEGERDLYQPFFQLASEISTEFLEYWKELDSNVISDFFLSQSQDELQAGVLRHVQLMNRSLEVVEDYKHLIEIKAKNPLQEALRQATLVGIEELILIHDILTKFNADVGSSQGFEKWDDQKNVLCSSIDEGRLKYEIMLEKEIQAWAKCNEEREKVEAKWEAVINQEKAEWRAKIRGSIYHQTSSNMTTDELKGHLAHMKENLKSKWQTNN